ncbi:L-type lectin-domain containing receptor kinase IX.2-like isoform X2 [Syzygium oleosum]|uniref:L-type lectin-domain containing receptor kinase IX.2-like isoform X2 n=1 Tax=Syzygium oleosum TaxID=219896 RepID=UPI0024B9E4D6|nr:L-type lectin-domain containing receptor kinase IX.2-like isoform X2 [Syzygium oleosum]
MFKHRFIYKKFVIMFLAVIRCRAIAAPLDPTYTAEEFERYLSNSESNLLLTPQEGNRPAQSAASKLNIPHLTAKLHSADSNITLSSTNIRPSLDLYVGNVPSDVALFLHYCGTPGLPKGVEFTQKELATVVLFNKHKYAESDSTVIEYPLLHYQRLVHELLSYLAAGAAVALPAAMEAATSSASRLSADMIQEVKSYRSKVARPYQSNDMPKGNNAPKTTEENKTKTERGGEEGGHSVKLTEEFEKLSGLKKFSYEELIIATADGKILGKGGFGIVYEGHIGDARTRVAVKIINSDSRQGLEEYKSEVMTLSQLRHKNLVRLLGYCHEANKFVLVYQFIGGGSLEDHLFKGRPLLTWERRYNIALGLALALHYLHKQCYQCVIHRDIKSSNVMLDEEFEAKLGDFGLAKLVDHTRDPNTTQVKGTPGYLSPEYLRTGKASKESNIYSFGVVLLEIVCGRRVFDPELVEQGLGLVQWVWKRCGCESWWGRRFWNFLLPVDERLGKDFDKKQVEALIILGLWCAHPIASSRPSIEEVMAVLNSTTKPPKLPSKMPSFNI